MDGDHPFFTPPFVAELRSLVERHHSIYPRLPPQGIFFESLVERAFLAVGWPREQIVPMTPNSPSHDLTVGATKISVKSETGVGTKSAFITITKLCTTETGTWDSASLIAHALAHLKRYEFLLMLRAVWGAGVLHYHLLDVPLDLLRAMSTATVVAVGRRTGRGSLAVDVWDQGAKLFRVHFDGADGKCQVKNLRVDRCRLLLDWDQPLAV